MLPAGHGAFALEKAFHARKLGVGRDMAKPAGHLRGPVIRIGQGEGRVCS